MLFRSGGPARHWPQARPSTRRSTPPPVSYTHLDVYKRQAVRESSEWDVVISDMRLGNDNGIDLLEWMRSNCLLYTSSDKWYCWSKQHHVCRDQRKE